MKYGKMKASGGMYMKVLVIDDSASDTQEIVSLFEEFQRQNSLHIEVDTTAVLPDALEVIKHYDIVILDIEIGTYNGIAFACELRCLSIDIRIIFVSNYSKYLLDGYKASANLYLLKPINPTQFALELQRIAWSYLYQQKSIYLPKLYEHKIYFKEIKYIEISDRKTILHLIKDRSISCYYTLKKWIQLVEDAPFVQPHRAFYVNASYIQQLHHDHIVLKDMTCIPITDIYRDRFQKDYLQYRNRGL